ncbi:MAG: hypothetical protein IKC19_01400 [Bacteroidales bacterium]|nr:hypothetical protein [Bacteroidales bacterium]
MKKHIVLFAAILACVGIANAQYNETNNLYYNAFRMPQSNQLNPAFMPNKTSVYVMLPDAGIRFGSPLAINDFVHNQGDTMTVISINDMLGALNNDNRFRIGIEANILGFGFKVHHTFFNFNTRIVSNVNVGLPIGTINALLHGNVDENGNAIKEVTFMDGSLFNAQGYAEISIGGGHYFEPIGLTVGAHAKLLYGLFNAQTDNTRAVLVTEDNYDKLKVDMYYQLQLASAAPLDTAGIHMPQINDLFNIGKANTGVAFDLGAKYDLGPFSFSLAINDLSAGIHWKHNVMSYTPEGGHVTAEFAGYNAGTIVNAGQVNNDSITAYWQEVVDNLTPAADSVGDYWYSIPTKINLGASYNFAKMLRAGILFHGQFDRGLLSKSNKYELDLGDGVANTFRFNTTLTVGVNLFNWAELTLGSSIVYDGNKIQPFNPGMNLVITPATAVQLYLTADYISSIYLVEAKAFNVRFGMNVLIGGGSKISQN